LHVRARATRPASWARESFAMRMKMQWIPVVLVVILGAACAPTVEQQRSARLEALQLELDSTLAAWQNDATRGHFGTSTNAARALVARYDQIYERWGLRADPLTQAMLAYSVAAAVRVDGKELSAYEANRLLEMMRKELDRERVAASTKRAEKPADRDAAMLACWTGFWTANQIAFAASPRNPVRCEVNASAADGKRVRCR
jgi:hypothetical protein